MGVKNFKATFEHILASTHVETDLYVFSNLSMDTLDYCRASDARRHELPVDDFHAV